MAVEDTLTQQDKSEGYILTCQAQIHGDVKSTPKSDHPCQ